LIPLREACFAPTGATVSVDILYLSYMRFRSGKTQRFTLKITEKISAKLALTS
jgi:hypothetical protein